ncbi:hypothetical protein SK128_002542, partial [Halocaridina rubra]
YGLDDTWTLTTACHDLAVLISTLIGFNCLSVRITQSFNPLLGGKKIVAITIERCQ